MSARFSGGAARAWATGAAVPSGAAQGMPQQAPGITTAKAACLVVTLLPAMSSGSITSAAYHAGLLLCVQGMVTNDMRPLEQPSEHCAAPAMSAATCIAIRTNRRAGACWLVEC